MEINFRDYVGRYNVDHRQRAIRSALVVDNDGYNSIRQDPIFSSIGSGSLLGRQRASVSLMSVDALDASA